MNGDPARIYEEFLGPAIALPWARLLLEYAEPKPGERVLDLACGTGIIARQVAPVVGTKGHVSALDASPAMLAVAAELPPPDGAAVEFLQGAAESLPFPSGAFDLVLCQQGLQFFPGKITALREMRRVLRDGGRTVLNVWQALDRHSVYEALLESVARNFRVDIAGLAVPFALSDPEELRALLEITGFSRIEVVSRTEPAYFPTTERFVFLSLSAAAAAVPAFAALDEAARHEAADAVARDIETVVRECVGEERMTIPMSANVAVAYAGDVSPPFEKGGPGAICLRGTTCKSP